MNNIYSEASEIKKYKLGGALCNCIVRTRDGIVGLIDANAELIDDKMCVYTLFDVFLCNPKYLIIVGFC